jgi:exopolysaccharide biosynthesis polyprenyl glycosylphosphotransferase
MRTESTRGAARGMVSQFRSTGGLRLEAPLHEDLRSALDQPAALPQGARSYESGSRAALVRRTLAIGDVGALAAAWWSTALLVGEPAPIALVVASLPLWLALGLAYGLYDADLQRPGHTTADDAVHLFHAVVVGTLLLWAGVQFGGVGADPALLGVFGALALPALAGARACGREVMRRRPAYVERVLIVGADRLGQLAASKLTHGRGVEVVGLVDTDLDAVPALVRQLGVDRVIVAWPADADLDVLALVRKLDDVPVQVDIVPRLFDALGPRAQLHDVCGLPLVGLPPRPRSPGAIVSKRLLDVAGAALLLVALAPVLAAIALTIRLTSPGPVLYRGDRIGCNGRRFKLLKFRTMRIECCRGAEYGGEDAEAAFRELMIDPAQRAQFERAHKLADDPRVTPVGRLLRRTSLDELPQVLNVLKGDIALVGPRPITVDEYTEDPTSGGYWTIPDLQPGITGYWQINGRSSTSYEERVRLDTAYATSRSLSLDLLILAKTGSALLDRRNAC